MRSAAPRPFWMVSTRVSSPSSGPIEAAADATPSALVAMITRSQGPGSDASVVASSRTVRSPLAPSTRSPRARIASMCSFQVSTAHTSFPADARRPAYTEPIAPAPTTAIFMSFLIESAPSSKSHRACAEPRKLGPPLLAVRYVVLASARSSSPRAVRRRIPKAADYSRCAGDGHGAPSGGRTIPLSRLMAHPVSGRAKKRLTIARYRGFMVRNHDF